VFRNEIAHEKFQSVESQLIRFVVVVKFKFEFKIFYVGNIQLILSHPNLQ
jgi:hypothetical protein